MLAIFDTSAPLISDVRSRLWHPRFLISFLRNLPYWARDFLGRQDGAIQLLARICAMAQVAWLRLKRDTDPVLTEAMALNVLDGIEEKERELIMAHLHARESYRPKPYPGKLTLFRVRGMRLFGPYDAKLGWEKLVTGGVEVRMVPGAHYNILARPYVNVLAAELKASLAQAHGAHQDDQVQFDR